MNKYLPKIFLIFFAVIFLFGCIKEKSYPSIPAIKFKSFTQFGSDSAHIIISFTDGDGDIGLEQGDTTGIYSSKSKYYYNLYVRYLYKAADGSFKPYEKAPGDTLDFKYRIPKLISDAQQKRALNGEIKVKLYDPYAVDDTVQYDLYIYDRALHRSNVVNTGTLILK